MPYPVSGYGKLFPDGFDLHLVQWWDGLPSHKAEYEPFIKRQLASRNELLGPCVVQIWSHHFQHFEPTKPANSTVWLVNQRPPRENRIGDNRNQLRPHPGKHKRVTRNQDPSSISQVYIRSISGLSTSGLSQVYLTSISGLFHVNLRSIAGLSEVHLLESCVHVVLREPSQHFVADFDQKATARIWP